MDCKKEAPTVCRKSGISLPMVCQIYGLHAGRLSQKLTLPALQKKFVNIFFVFAWEFRIEKWRGFLVNFFWSPSPTKRSTRSPRKIRENSEQNSGQNSGRKFEKFGKLSFCNFSDLTTTTEITKTMKIELSQLQTRS